MRKLKPRGGIYICGNIVNDLGLRRCVVITIHSVASEFKVAGYHIYMCTNNVGFWIRHLKKQRWALYARVVVLKAAVPPPPIF